MNFLKSAVLAFGMLLIAQASVFAQPADTKAAAAAEAPADEEAVVVPAAPFSNLNPIGVGLIIFGAALGIGMLAKAAVESMARQPEIARDIQGAMVVAAALIEGVTFFALIIMILQVYA
jgi:F-type H+-transporting ATPase subunit c